MIHGDVTSGDVVVSLISKKENDAVVSGDVHVALIQEWRKSGCVLVCADFMLREAGR